MASLTKAFHPSTIRVFNEENQRFILDPTFPSVDHGMAKADSFISPFEYELPLVV